MKRKTLLVLAFLLIAARVAHAQPSSFAKWYQNPLGFKPVELHASNGIIIPAIAATILLFFTKKDTTLANRITYYDDLGISFGYYASRTTIYQNNIGILYQVRKYMSLGTEFTTYHVFDAINNTWGFGVRPFARFYPIHKENFKLFFQSGAGLIYFLKKFPQPSGFFADNRLGTNLNACPKYGAGSEFKLASNFSAQVAIWHVHVSNGNIPSVERNPAHDGDGFSFGLLYKPGKRKH